MLTPEQQLFAAMLGMKPQTVGVGYGTGGFTGGPDDPNTGGPGRTGHHGVTLFGPPGKSLYGTSGDGRPRDAAGNWLIPWLQSPVTGDLRREGMTAREGDRLIRSIRQYGMGSNLVFDPTMNRWHIPAYKNNDPSLANYWQTFRNPGTAQALLNFEQASQTRLDRRATRRAERKKS